MNKNEIISMLNRDCVNPVSRDIIIAFINEQDKKIKELKREKILKNKRNPKWVVRGEQNDNN